jgi:DegV family protein with EDD domain
VEEANALGVTVAPLYIQFPEGEVDSRTMTPDEFYVRLKAMVPKFPTTSMPAPSVFGEIYHNFIEKGEEILSIHISSGLSGTINAARQGAEQLAATAAEALKKIHVVDAMTLSGGQRFQVLAAAKAIQAGWSREKVIERLEALRAKTEVIYTLDTLDYLARGGRIGRVQALAGALLNLKPIIHVDRTDGKYSTLGKARTISKAVTAIVDHLAEEYQHAAVHVTVLHGQFSEQADILAAQLRERLNVATLEVMRISPVLGVHTGPGIVGAAVAPADLMADFA